MSNTDHYNKMGYEKAYAAFNPDTSLVFSGNHVIAESLGFNHNDEDTVFGVQWVYCGSHRRVHSTGWCTVRIENKMPLRAETKEEAIKEAKAVIPAERILP